MPLGQYNAGNFIYRLENVNDSSGNNRTLTNDTSVGFSAGRFSNCADFGSSNTTKHLYRNDASGFSSSSSRTMSLWIKMQTDLSGANTWKGLLAITHADIDVEYRIVYQRVSNVNKLSYDRGKRGAASSPYLYTISLGTSNWYHILMTWDGTNINAYLNGVYLGQSGNSGNGTNGYYDRTRISATTSDSDGGTNSNSYVSAWIDEVFAQPVVFTASQVKKYYAYAKGRWATL